MAAMDDRPHSGATRMRPFAMAGIAAIFTGE